MTDTILPEILFVQKGHVGNQDLFVNRTPQGVMAQNLGPAFKPGAHVGVYQLQKIVSAEVAVQDVAAPAVAATPTAASTG